VRGASGKRRPSRVALAGLALFGLAAGVARGEEPAEPKKPVPRRIPVVEIPGIRWERDFAAGMRRAPREGRPVLLAVNAIDSGEVGNQVAANDLYPSKELGDPSRAFVCFVCNPNDHPTRTLADETVVCGRYGVGTCACHKDALAWLLRHHAPDGLTVVSPSHWVFEPDGALFWHEDYVQSAPTPERLDAWTVAIAPRLAMRRVWTARDARLSALAKRPAADLEKEAAAWLASGDGLAAAGLVAMLDQEGDPARRKALFAVLARAGPAAAPLLFDSVDAATSNPDADPDAAVAWTRLAHAVDPSLGTWAAARTVARSKQPTLRSLAIDAVVVDGPLPRVDSPARRAQIGEALALAGERSGLDGIPVEGEGALPAGRLARARAAAGLPPPPGREEWWTDRAGILGASAERVKARRDELVLLLEKRSTTPEVRVAAALALRRAGDGVGVPVLLWALADPVEGPEARAELARLSGGDDLGDDPSAWEPWLRGGDGGGR
jgi:hypothetical protein